MKAEELLYSLDHVGEDLLAAAEQNVLSRQRRPWLKTAVAAALVVALGVGGFLILKHLRSTEPVSASDPPVLTMSQPETESEPTPDSALPVLFIGQTVRGMSVLPLADMEAYLASNPWREEQRLNTLPVYRAEELTGDLSEEDLALLLARALDTLECNPAKDYELKEAENGSTQLVAGTELGTLSIDGRGQLTLLLDAEHRLTPELPARTEADAPEEETLVRCWLDWLSQFTKLNPASRWAIVKGAAPAVVTLPGADEPLYRAEVYPLLSGDERSQAAAYSLERVTLYYRDDTLCGFTLPGLRLYESHLEEVLYDGASAQSGLPQTETPVGHPLMWDNAGSYPLLSPEAARAMALKGQTLLGSEEVQITGRYLDLPTAYEDPAQIPMDLVYLPNETGELMLPFYRFLWPVGADEDGNTVCHLSYVPAIDPAWLQDWPPTAEEALTRNLPEGYTAPDAETIQAIQALFEDWEDWYCRALLNCYSNPLNADLEQLFYLGIPDMGDLSPEEREKLEALGHQEVSVVGCQRMPGKEVDAVLTTLFGLNRNAYVQTGKGSLETLLGEDVVYLAEYDCYYGFRSDSIGGPVTIRGIGLGPDGLLSVFYDFGDERNVTLQPVEDGWQILSNLPLQRNASEGLLSDLALEDFDPGTTDLGIGIKLLQNDDRRVIFYGYFGLLALDSGSGDLLFTVDFDKAVDCHGLHSVEGGEFGVSAAISADGTRLKISYGDMDQIYDSCLIDLEHGSYRKNDPAAQELTWASLDSVNGYDAWGTDDWILSSLWLRRGGEKWYPFR